MTEVLEDKKMGRPKLQRRDWQEPKRKEKYPTLTAEGVAKKLGYVSTEMVHDLARRGPELGGIPTYIISPTGNGWIRKPDDAKPRNVKSFFYEEDIEAFKAKRPKKAEHVHVDYTEEEKQYVLSEAEQFRNEQGQVHRVNLYRHLGWDTRAYKKLKQILDDAGIEDQKIKKH